MKKLIAITLACFAGTISSVLANDITGKVVSVIDGNTVEITSSTQEKHKVILVGIDCPEIGQQFGAEAKKFTEKILLNKDVTVSFTGKDRWGNQLAIVKIKGTRDARVDILKEGLAWTAEKNPDPDLDTYRSNAQEKGKGLWKEENPTPPWTYRRMQTMTEAKSG